MPVKAKEDTRSSTEVAKVRPHEILKQRLQLNATVMDNSDPAVGQEISNTIVDRIVAADTVEDIFDAQESALESLKDNVYLIGLPLTVLEYRVLESSPELKREDGYDYFAVMQAVEDTGELHTIGCGAPQVLATLDGLDRLGKLPYRLRFVNAGRSGRVIRVQNLPQLPVTQ